MDDAIAAVILGQDPRTDSGGALAAASKERSAVRLDLVQADSDLLSETLNHSLIAWLAEFNGIGPVNVYRQVKEEEDLKVSAETDALIASLGFNLSEDAVRAKYGEGWTRNEEQRDQKAETAGEAGGNFAEPLRVDPAQTEIDRVLGTIPDETLDAALEDILRPLLAAIDKAGDFDDALARAAVALPGISVERLAGLLHNALFGAETYGRLA